VGGAAIGAMQVFDAVILFSNNGVGEGISLVLSGIEFIWAVVSFVVLVRIKHKPTRLLALAFVGYNVFGWLLAISALPQGTPMTVPMWFVVLGGIFGAGYSASSVRLARQP
jgi:hypothetical protein